jgi:hypothetical protein
MILIGVAFLAALTAAAQGWQASSGIGDEAGFVEFVCGPPNLEPITLDNVACPGAASRLFRCANIAIVRSGQAVVEA